jgi:hypothetical protein
MMGQRGHSEFWLGIASENAPWNNPLKPSGQYMYSNRFKFYYYYFYYNHRLSSSQREMGFFFTGVNRCLMTGRGNLQTALSTPPGDHTLHFFLV